MGVVARTRAAPAKLNLALVVGPTRPDGKHEVVTLLQRIELADEVSLRPAGTISVEGFSQDTIVRAALEEVQRRTGGVFAAHLRKEIPVAAGVGGGSSDAAIALLLANELLGEPLTPDELREIAARLGSDVPFFLVDGPQLGRGDGSQLVPQGLPQEFTVLLALPHGARKTSTAAVYGAFDDRGGAAGFEDRRQALLDVLPTLTAATDLAHLPLNDLASSPLATRVSELGAFRSDVSGAGPVVYGLFEDAARASAAAVALGAEARTWVTRPRWYR
jgi:4-diphosphocytidyl-2-C-methyl-D-erythritol kinase